MYSKTSLILKALGEKFCVGIDRVSDYTVQNTYKMVKWEKKMSDNPWKRITQVSDKTGFTVYNISLCSFISCNLL